MAESPMTIESSEQRTIRAEVSNTGERLDVFLSQKLDISRSAAQKLEVVSGGKALSKNYKLQGTEEFCVTIPAPEPTTAQAQNIPLSIVYEDDDLLVVNKPQGMVVHPAAGNRDGTLVNALLYLCGDELSSVNGMVRPGIVHRLDKDTAGLLIVAKNDFSHRILAKQIEAHTFTRCYRAVIWGRLKEDSGTVDAPIGRHKTDRKRMAVTFENSRRALTHFKVLERYRGFTHVQLALETGRTHQIRVHMAHLGHPVVGDRVYAKGRDVYGLDGQCLFAEHIGFKHPTTGEFIEFNAPLPDFFTNLFKKLGQPE